ncbi:ORF6N domain-containing protein [Acidithiobacillus sp.]|uniref:ORF6N domain-containing protein n=1 Tax=Acidithiobacillus sp. TaxID=1872118 RepID=UPI00258A0ACA|nr:ORF6N domain-containing protein [Acidithiobacillus sp.]MDD5375542.1 ORF6N domain-containing protein [Acidithiobacillus sp.]
MSVDRTRGIAIVNEVMDPLDGDTVFGQRWGSGALVRITAKELNALMEGKSGHPYRLMRRRRAMDNCNNKSAKTNLKEPGMGGDKDTGIALRGDSLRSLIYTVRGMEVMLDSDLAGLYGVETRVFNQAVKRNIERFPESFRFHLTQVEYDSLRSPLVTLNEEPDLRSQSVTSSAHGGRRYHPYAYQGHHIGRPRLFYPDAIAGGVIGASFGASQS